MKIFSKQIYRKMDMRKISVLFCSLFLGMLGATPSFAQQKLPSGDAAVAGAVYAPAPVDYDRYVRVTVDMIDYSHWQEEVLTIPANTPEGTMIKGSQHRFKNIYDEGMITLNYTLIDHDESSAFGTVRIRFDGQGWDNTYSIQKQESVCASNTEGKYILYAHNRAKCKFDDEIADDEWVYVFWKPEVSPVFEEAKTYQFNAVLLFANYDGLRIGTLPEEYLDLLEHPEKFYQQGHGYLQNSEISGTIKVRLPENALEENKVVTVYDASNWPESQSFMSPQLISVQFTLPEGANPPSTLEIECNLNDERDGIVDISRRHICDGVKRYVVDNDEHPLKNNNLKDLVDPEIDDETISALLSMLPTQDNNDLKDLVGPEIDDETISALLSTFPTQDNNDLKYLVDPVIDNNDNIPTLLAYLFTMSGYHKLSTSYGDKNMEEVIASIISASEIDWKDLFENNPVLAAGLIHTYLDNISGVFMLGASVHKLEDKYLEAENKKYVTHSGYWDFFNDGYYNEAEPSNKDMISPGAELFGQLYVMPDSQMITATRLLGTMANQFPDGLVEVLDNITVPYLVGPAIPLYDRSRLKTITSEFHMGGENANGFKTGSFNVNKDKLMVFATLTDADYDDTLGDVFQVDDCLAKGKIFGFETLDFSASDSAEITRCEFPVPNSYVTIHRTGALEEDISGQAEYELRGELTFNSIDGAGDQIEPYGDIKVLINGISYYPIWSVASGNVGVNENTTVRVPFKVQFLSSTDDITIETTNKIMEEDTGDDDVIGDMHYTWNLSPNGKEEVFSSTEEDGDGGATLRLSLIKVGDFR
ncbi:hypothetical protein [Vibrio aestuarianus]|uniref:hypothetical protein n=1 Tax=Vibrio aestuarianus TaxID=28171 RepID=UPI00237CE77B|nr:hypothetical protein [Vibrio aestuarianus]MDE1336270.1 hypothetical protein [Vibrio aestuarianus]